MPFRGLGGASDLGNWVRGFSVMDGPASINLDYLRQLIAEARSADSKDDERLRMLQYGLGMNALTTTRGDQ